MRKALYILGQLSDEDVDWMIRVGRRLPVRAGTALIRQGQPIEGLYLILDGEFLVTDPKRGSKKLRLLQAGEIVGEMSFVERGLPSASVQADVDGLVLEIPTRLLRERLAHDPAFAARFYFAIALFLSSRLRDTEGRLELSRTGRSEASGAGDELDLNVLDAVHLAGNRFTAILQRLAEGGNSR
jgi:CRP-like cAMP-binding protein